MGGGVVGGGGVAMLNSMWGFVVIFVQTFCETFDAKLAEVETAVKETFLRHEANIYGGMLLMKHT